jgi:hypothetical protein
MANQISALEKVRKAGLDLIQDAALMGQLGAVRRVDTNRGTFRDLIRGASSE